MTKKELVSILKQEHKRILNKKIKVACDTWDYLKKHTYKKEKDGTMIYVIDGKQCFCIHRNLEHGTLSFMPLNSTDDLGKGCGNSIHLDFWD